MKIGFIGAGNVTRTFGHHLINAGHTIVVSNPEVRRPWLILSLILVQAPSRGPGGGGRVRRRYSRCTLGERA